MPSLRPAPVVHRRRCKDVLSAGSCSRRRGQAANADWDLPPLLVGSRGEHPVVEDAVASVSSKYRTVDHARALSWVAPGEGKVAIQPAATPCCRSCLQGAAEKAVSTRSAPRAVHRAGNPAHRCRFLRRRARRSIRVGRPAASTCEDGEGATMGGIETGIEAVRAGREPVVRRPRRPDRGCILSLG